MLTPGQSKLLLDLNRELDSCIARRGASKLSILVDLCGTSYALFQKLQVTLQVTAPEEYEDLVAKLLKVGIKLRPGRVKMRVDLAAERRAYEQQLREKEKAAKLPARLYGGAKLVSVATAPQLEPLSADDYRSAPPRDLQADGPAPAGITPILRPLVAGDLKSPCVRTALEDVLEILQTLSVEDRGRVLAAALAFYGVKSA